MAKNKRRIVTTIPVRLTESELQQLEKVKDHLELPEYSKTFIAAISELTYLIAENKRLETLIQKLHDEKNNYQESLFESFSEEERQQANAIVSDGTGRKEPESV